MPDVALPSAAARPVRARWEWRTFGRAIPIPAGVESITSEESSAETYLLCSRTTFNLKIRDGRLDVKRLDQVDEHGLEQWRPVRAAAFPMAIAAVHAVCADLGYPSPELSNPVEVDGLIEVLRRADPSLTPVLVRKRRIRWHYRGCQGEHAVLTVRGEQWETMALEHENPETVFAAVQSVGGVDAVNSNYPRALKRICGISEPTIYTLTEVC
jgi:hypothetical protein